jgi:hypothetical protein
MMDTMQEEMHGKTDPIVGEVAVGKLWLAHHATSYRRGEDLTNPGGTRSDAEYTPVTTRY